MDNSAGNPVAVGQLLIEYHILCSKTDNILVTTCYTVDI